MKINTKSGGAHVVHLFILALEWTLKQLNYTFIDIYQVKQDIGHSSVVMTEKYAKCNLRRLQDDFPTLRERIALRLVSPAEDLYFTKLLQSV